MAPIFSLILLLSLSISTPKAFGANFLNTACVKTPEPKTCLFYLSRVPESKTLTSFKGSTKISVAAFQVWMSDFEKVFGVQKSDRSSPLYKPENTICVRTCLATSFHQSVPSEVNMRKAANIGDFVSVTKDAFTIMNNMLPCEKSCRLKDGSSRVQSLTDMSTTLIKLSKITIALAKLESGQ